MKKLNSLGLLAALSLTLLAAACGDATQTAAPAAIVPPVTNTPLRSTVAAATTAAGAGAAAGIPPANGTATKTASGLQYIDIQPGNGAVAVKGRQVVVHYTGWLTNGKKFDSSVDRGKPFDFPLGAGRVIQGWDEGVAGMKVGGKRRLMIPPALGYGPQGSPPVIPANADLIFDVELLEVK